MQNVLLNYEFYGPFEELARTGTMTIYPKELNSNNIDSYREGLMNIFKDGIETDFVKQARVRLQWDNNIGCNLSLHDTFYNLVMWKMITDLDQKVEPYNIFYSKSVSADTIKDYIDENIASTYVDKVDVLRLNRVIYDSYKHLMDIDIFAKYLGNTFDLWDFVELVKKHPRVNEMFNKDYDVSIENAQDFWEKMTDEFLRIIDEESLAVLGRDHCCANAKRARSGLSPRQFKELSLNIGTKPDGRGSIYPHIINSSFIDKGLDSLESMFVETASAGRYAQIISKGNVATSGAFARILGLNNMDTFLNEDPEFVCNTKNFVKFTIPDASSKDAKKIFKMLIGRFYRESENGVDKLIHKYDMNRLLGKTIYLRDPMTCESKARGYGICYKCYGRLAYTTRYINIGKIAAEILSALLTQRLLSAKHLLAAKPIKIVFGEMFAEFFNNEELIISLNPEVLGRHAFIKINVDDIESSVSEDDVENDDEASLNMNEFISEFILEVDGVEYSMHSDNYDSLFITPEFTRVLNRVKTVYEDDKSIKSVPIADVSGIPIFQLPLVNNELVKSLNEIKHIINLTKVTSSLTKDEILQRFIETIVQGGLNIHSSHASVILSNLIRDKNDILDTPDWTVPNQSEYQILPLSSALSNHPSITISLMYQGISRALISPITYKKNKPSRMDMYFMEQPQVFLKDNNDSYVERNTGDGPRRPFRFSSDARRKEREYAMNKRAEREHVDLD